MIMRRRISLHNTNYVYLLLVVLIVFTVLFPANVNGGPSSWLPHIYGSKDDANSSEPNPPTQFHSAGNGLAISEVSILLSWGSTGARLHAKGAECFMWSTTDNTLLNISPLSLPCSNEATVAPLPAAAARTRRSANVIAQDRRTGRSVQCEVFVDRIAGLKILHTARKLVVGEMQTIAAQAFDNEGNTFSVLSGLRFDWTTDNTGASNGGGPDVLQLLPVDDVSVHLDYRPDVEGLGLEASYIVVRGAHVGESHVKLRLRDANGDAVREDAVRLAVVDHFILEPAAVVRLIPGAELQYRLRKRVEEDRFQDIPMPDSRFRWTSSSDNIATIHPDKGVLSALQVGTTNIAVHDREFPLSEAHGVAVIVEPHYLRVRVRPLSKRLYTGYEQVASMLPEVAGAADEHHLVEFTEYSVEVEVYDREHQRITVTPNMELTLSVDGDCIHTTDRLSSHRVTIRTTATGRARFSASLQRTPSERSDIKYDPRSKEGLSIDQTVRVYHRVAMQNVVADSLYLPVDDGVSQMYSPGVSGGSALYRWVSLNPEVVAVDQSGTMHSIAEGEALVVVFDRSNMFNGDAKRVIVTRPASAEILDGEREAAVGSDLCVQAAVRDARGHSFANFTSLSVGFHVLDTDIYTVPLAFPMRAESNCPQTPSVFAFRALQEGFTAIRMKLAGRSVDKIAVAAFPPLSIVERYDPIVAALGSTATITITGGPRPWTEYGSERQEKAVYTDRSVRIVMGRKRGEQRRSYKATCTELGSQTLKFTVTNTIAMPGARPTVVSVSRRFVCTPPAAVSLVPLHAATDTELQPLPVSQSQTRVFNVRNNHTLPIVMKVYSSDGDVFAAVDSLLTEWGLSETRLGHWAYSPLEHLGRKMLHLREEEGAIIVSIRVDGYDAARLRESGIGTGKKISDNHPAAFPPLSSDVELRVTSHAYLVPAHYTLFRSPRVSVVVRAGGGSGRFEFRSNTTELATHRILGPSSVEVWGTHEGYVEITATDVGFPQSTPARASIKISDVAAVSIEGPHLVQTHHRSIVHLVVTDTDGQRFDAAQYHAMLPQLDADNDAAVELQPGNTSDTFVIYGLQPATVRVVAAVVNSEGRRVHSLPFEMHVYEPLHVDPPELVLIPGARYQLQVLGGPARHLSHTEFTIDNDAYATVDERGVVEASRRTLGSTRIVVSRHSGLRMEDDPAAAEEDYARVEVPVHVVAVRGVSLPSTLTVYEDHTLPLPLRLDTSRGPPIPALNTESDLLNITIRTSSPDIAAVRFPYTARRTISRSLTSKSNRRSGDTRIETEMETETETRHTGHTLLVEGVRTGMADIGVEVRMQGADGGKFRGSVGVHVVRRLWAGGVRCMCHRVLMAPGTDHHVHTSRPPQESSLKYTMLDSPHYERVATVSANGELRAGDTEGVSVVLVEDVIDGQMASLEVAVRRPRFLRIASSRFKEFVLPVGANATFPIQMLDDKGEVFSSRSPVPIRVRQNGHDAVTATVSADGKELVVQARELGSSTVGVYGVFLPTGSDYNDYSEYNAGSNINPMSDSLNTRGHGYGGDPHSAMATNIIEPFFARFTVVSVIDATALRVHIGSRLNLTMRSSYGDNRSDSNKDIAAGGLWRSGDESIVQVNPYTGAALATGLGGTRVYLKAPEFTTFTEIDVIQFTRATLDTSNTPFLTLNTLARQQRTYHLPVCLYDNHDNPIRLKEMSAAGISLECFSRSPLVSVETRLSPDRSGEYMCEITPRSDGQHHQQSHLSSTKTSTTTTTTSSNVDEEHDHERVENVDVSIVVQADSIRYTLPTEGMPLLITDGAHPPPEDVAYRHRQHPSSPHTTTRTDRDYDRVNRRYNGDSGAYPSSPGSPDNRSHLYPDHGYSDGIHPWYFITARHLPDWARRLSIVVGTLAVVVGLSILMRGCGSKDSRRPRLYRRPIGHRGHGFGDEDEEDEDEDDFDEMDDDLDNLDDDDELLALDSDDSNEDINADLGGMMGYVRQ